MSLPALSEQNDFFKSVLDNLYDGVYFVDRYRTITYWNKGAERISGYSSQQVQGRSCANNLLMHVDSAGHSLCQDGCPLAATIADGQVREVQVFLHHADGHRLPVAVRATPIYDENGSITGAVEVFSDNTHMLAALQQVQQLRKAVTQDALTGIGNRLFIEMKLQSLLTEFRLSGNVCGVLFIDIDHFKEVNDRFGHASGDQVLRMVAQTLRQNIRSSDYLGRWGGEEFLVAFQDIDAPQLHAIAEKLRRLVAVSSLTIAGQSLHVTISIGATLAHPLDDLDTLVERADRLMYTGKAAGRNRVNFSV